MRPKFNFDPPHLCSDCGEEVFSHFTTVPVTARGRCYCQSCTQWRSKHGFLFDVRIKSDLIHWLSQQENS